MIDYSRAAKSKALKKAVDSTADSLIMAIQELKDSYGKEWEAVEELRKGYAAIIESVSPILKANNVKLDKPLDRCNHEEIMQELHQAAADLPFEPREEIEVAMVRMDNRYTQIQEQAKKLNKLNDQLSKYHLPEQDYEKEVVISLKDLEKTQASRKKAPQVDLSESKTSTRESKVIPIQPYLEEVESVTKADDSLLKSFEELVESEVAISTPHILEESDITLEPSDEEFSFNDAFDSLFGEEPNEEIDDASLMAEFLESKEENLSEEADYQTYELNEDQTLSKIVDHIYDGKLSWYDIYLYGNNQEMIDKRCANLKIDPEDAAYTEGVLSGIEIEFPKNFVIYESVMKQEEKGRAKAA